MDAALDGAAFAGRNGAIGVRASRGGAVVAGENHGGILRETEAVEFVEELADLPIHVSDRAGVERGFALGRIGAIERSGLVGRMHGDHRIVEQKWPGFVLADEFESEALRHVRAVFVAVDFTLSVCL